MKQRLLILIFFPMGLLFADSNCHISIQTEKWSGQKLRVNFQSTQPTKNHCKKLAEMHEPNFNPEAIRRKVVSFKWNGELTVIDSNKKRGN